jgi:hypothetical protein
VIMDFVLSGVFWLLWGILISLVKYLLSWLFAAFDLYFGFIAYATLALHCALHCDWPRTLRRFARFQFDAVMRDTEWDEYKARSHVNVHRDQPTGDAPYLLTMHEFKPGAAYTVEGRRTQYEPCGVCRRLPDRGHQPVDIFVHLAGLNFHPHCAIRPLDQFLYARYRLLCLMAVPRDLCDFIGACMERLSCIHISNHFDTWARVCKARVEQARVAAAEKKPDNPA